MKSIELFAGAGGLAMGVSKAGFEHQAVVEFNHEACNTIRENQRQDVTPVVKWPLFEMDVRHFDYRVLPKNIDLVAGGPPCQPFSIGGKHRGHRDDRNMFPELVRAARSIQPRAVLFENVRGLLRQSFAKYFEYILLQISYPELILKDGEFWIDHLARLERYHTHGRQDGLSYRVVFQSLNAAAHGVPQRRERVFIVAFRSDQKVPWSFPTPTHSRDALLWDQWVTGDYWERHQIPANKRPGPPAKLNSRIERLRSMFLPPSEKPFRTVRDAISGLPDPKQSSQLNTRLSHRFIPGARSYPGHTGSPLDEPAKTLKAGDHGVPGGENMLAHPNGKVRYFTVRESARLQAFPDDYIFPSSWTETMRQLGNAVPVTLAHKVASEIKRSLRQAAPSRE